MSNELFDAIARCTTELPAGNVAFRANPFVADTFGVRLTWETDERMGAVLRDIPAERSGSAAQILLEMLNMAKTKIGETKGAN